MEERCLGSGCVADVCDVCRNVNAETKRCTGMVEKAGVNVSPAGIQRNSFPAPSLTIPLIS